MARYLNAWMVASSIAALALTPRITSAEIAGVITIQAVHPLTALAATSANDSAIVMPPSVPAGEIGALVSTITLTALCINTQSGAPVPNCNLQLTAQALSGTGGHQHDDGNRPAGTLNPSSGRSGADGTLPVEYTAPEVSGMIRVTLTGTDPNGNPVAPSTAEFGVGIRGLQALLPSPTFYQLVGATTPHPDNHYATPQLNQALTTLGLFYTIFFPGQTVLGYNDSSLVWGGVFDLAESWGAPHHSHRFGNDVDLRTSIVPVQNLQLLRMLIQVSGIPTIIVEKTPPHWHLRQ